jgi:hypothetical protein
MAPTRTAGMSAFGRRAPSQERAMPASDHRTPGTELMRQRYSAASPPRGRSLYARSSRAHVPRDWIPGTWSGLYVREPGAGMREGSRYVGYTEGKSIVIEFRWADIGPYFLDGLQRRSVDVVDHYNSGDALQNEVATLLVS